MIAIKDNLKKILLMFLTGIFCFGMALSSYGCSWFPTDPGKQYMQGVKVLRKPATYDFDGNSVTSNYYYSLADDIFRALYNTYGIVGVDMNAFPNTKTEIPDDYYLSIFPALADNAEDDDQSVLTALNNSYTNSADTFKYFYDAIRYQVTSVTPNNNGTEEDASDDYYTITIDTNKGWNWSIARTGEGMPVDFFTGAMTADPVGQSSTYKISAADYESYFTYDAIKDYYSTPVQTTAYNNALELGLRDPASPEAYTGSRQMALEYAIYCFVLGIEPAEVTNNNGNLSIAGFNTVKEARDSMKETFGELGTYVGLTSKNRESIKTFIKETVIGESAMAANNIVNLYYEEMVNAIVNYCTSLTPIAQSTEEGDSSLSVGNAFVASEIVDYPADSFFVGTESGKDEFKAGSFEYQSMVFLPSVKNDQDGNPLADQTTHVSDVWLDFYYEARDSHGNLIDDESRTLDIDVIFNWWTGSELKTGTRQITLINQFFDSGKENTTLATNFDEGPDGLFGEGLFGERVVIAPLSNVLAGIDVASSPNKTTADDGVDVLTLRGTTSARTYYELRESAYNGGIGVLNRNKMGSTPYLEIVFDVKKMAGDRTKNYDFYVAVVMFETFVPDRSWVQ